MHVERSIDIKAPREFVWQLVHDTALRPKWDVRVAAIRIHGEPIPGTQAAITWRTPVVRCVSAAEVTAFDAPVRSAMAIDEASLPIFPPGERTWLFEETRSGTRVTTRFEFDSDDEQPAPGWLVRLVMRRDMKRSLKNLRRLAAESLAQQRSPRSALDTVAESA